jgi:hypothetical protein
VWFEYLVVKFGLVGGQNGWEAAFFWHGTVATSAGDECGEMSHQLSIHVHEEMERRGIPLAVVESVLAAPAQKVPEHGDIVCYQSKVYINQKPYLLRVMVNETATPPKVVTVYRTSKISKYWKGTT